MAAIESNLKIVPVYFIPGIGGVLINKSFVVYVVDNIIKIAVIIKINRNSAT